MPSNLPKGEATMQGNTTWMPPRYCSQRQTAAISQAFITSNCIRHPRRKTPHGSAIPCPNVSLASAKRESHSFLRAQQALATARRLAPEGHVPNLAKGLHCLSPKEHDELFQRSGSKSSPASLAMACNETSWYQHLCINMHCR